MLFDMTTALSDLLEIYEINADIRKNIIDNIDRTPDIRNVADPQEGKSTVIRATKMQEAGKAKNSAIDSMKEAIGSAELFINGAHVTDIHTHDAASRINEPRVLYFFYVGKKIVATNGFVKKTQKTPAKELKLAKERRADWLSRHKEG